MEWKCSIWDRLQVLSYRNFPCPWCGSVSGVKVKCPDNSRFVLLHTGDIAEVMYRRAEP